jgi:excisionase family DNA binding protein
MPSSTLSELLNRGQAAEYLTVSLRTLDEQTSIGNIPVVRIGRACRFRKSALDYFIEANESRARPKRRAVARAAAAK